MAHRVRVIVWGGLVSISQSILLAGFMWLSELYDPAWGVVCAALIAGGGLLISVWKASQFDADAAVLLDAYAPPLSLCASVCRAWTATVHESAFAGAAGVLVLLFSSTPGPNTVVFGAVGVWIAAVLCLTGVWGVLLGGVVPLCCVCGRLCRRRCAAGAAMRRHDAALAAQLDSIDVRA